MKILRYLLGASVLMSGIDLMLTTSIGSLYACPRCRRAQPKGPRKLPHPGFSNKKESAKNSIKDPIEKSPNSCSQSCCCAQKKEGAPR